MFEFVLDQMPEHEQHSVTAALAVLAGVGYFVKVADAHVAQIAESFNSDETESALAKEIVETRRKVALLKELHGLGDQLRTK